MNGPITTEETYHISNILRHYAHAKEKHPYFCDRITCLSASGAYSTKADAIATWNRRAK